MRIALLALLLTAGTAEAGKNKKKGKKGAEPIAQEEQPTIALPCGAEAGSQWRYESARMRTDISRPEVADVRTLTPLTVTWLEPGPPTIVTWTHGASRFEGLPDGAEINEQMQLAAQVMDGVPMEVVVDQGFAVGVRNVDALVTAMEPIFEMFEKDSPEAAQKTRDLFGDPVLGPQLLLRDVRPFWAMICSEMQVGSVVMGETQFPNPFGGAPIVGTESFALKSVDSVGRTATYETLTATDPDSILKAIEPVLKQILPPGADEAQLTNALTQLPPIDTRAIGIFVMSLDDGMPLSVEVIQTVGSGELVHKSDSWIWTRQ